MAPLFGTRTKNNNSDKIERVQRRAARFVKSRYSRYSSVSDMLDVLGWTPLSQLLLHGTGLLLLKLRHWLYLDPILFKISVHPFRIIP